MKSGNGEDGRGHGRKQPVGLPKNEKLVWDVLAISREPLKAYEILDRLKEKGVRAPMTIYRALDGLELKGHIHKLEGMNAFVLCNHDGPHPVQSFLVCESCSFVRELNVRAIEADIAPAVKEADFQMTNARLEIKGRCPECAAKA
ncbi:MAG: Fur family transcriptional regulator [Pseudomonadota bacterium]